MLSEIEAISRAEVARLKDSLKCQWPLDVWQFLGLPDPTPALTQVNP